MSLDGSINPCAKSSESCLSTQFRLNGGGRRGACLTGVVEPVSMVCSDKWVRPKLPSSMANRSLISLLPSEGLERSARNPSFQTEESISTQVSCFVSFSVQVYYPPTRTNLLSINVIKGVKRSHRLAWP